MILRKIEQFTIIQYKFRLSCQNFFNYHRLILNIIFLSYHQTINKVKIKKFMLMFFKIKPNQKKKLSTLQNS